MQQRQLQQRQLQQQQRWWWGRGPVTGRESLQGLVLPGQWPLRAPQAALPEHPLLSPGQVGGGGWGLPAGAAHPPSALCPPQWLCPCSDPLRAGAGVGASQVLPTEPNRCQGAPAALRVLCAAAPAPSEGACPAVGSPSRQRPACHASGSSGTGKAPGSARGGGLSPMPMGTASPCWTPLPGASHSWCCGVGSASACPLPRAPGRAPEPLHLHDGAMCLPQPCPTRCPLLLPSPSWMP